MTNYNLEDFKKWLEADPTRKEGLNWNGSFSSLPQTDQDNFKDFIISPRANRYSQSHLAVARKWANWIVQQERERERERERANEEASPNMKCIKCQKEVSCWLAHPGNLCAECLPEWMQTSQQTFFREENEEEPNMLEDRHCSKCHKLTKHIQENSLFYCTECSIFGLTYQKVEREKKLKELENELSQSQNNNTSLNLKIIQLEKELQIKREDIEAAQAKDIAHLKDKEKLLREELRTRTEKYQQSQNKTQEELQEKSNQLTSTLKSVQDLQQENRTIKEQTEAKKQRILALEADKQDLIQQLSQTKQEHQQYLNQEKIQLTQEITLLKGVLT